jgi:HSP20 family protein
MALIRWSPASELMNLHSEMDRVFNEMWQDFQGFGLVPRVNGGAQGHLPLDIERTEDALLIHASVPGFTPEEVSVTLESGVLTIDAHHQQEAEQKERNWIRQERFSGRLYRQIALGEGVNSDEAQATFENGVLTVRVPHTPRPEPKKIPVVTGQTAGSASQS